MFFERKEKKRFFFVALSLLHTNYGSTVWLLSSSLSGFYYYFLRKPFNMYQQTTLRTGEKSFFYKVKIGLSREYGEAYCVVDQMVFKI